MGRGFYPKATPKKKAARMDGLSEAPSGACGTEPPSGGEALQMVVGVAELGVDHQQTLEVVTDAQLLGHAHTVVPDPDAQVVLRLLYH